MRRRKLLIGMGSLAAGGAAATGTGAFTSVSAERTVNVSVADDSDALLGLTTDPDGDGTDEAANADYVDTSGSEVTITLDSDASTTGSGVNADATTQINDLFRVVNQGTQAAVVYVPPSSISQNNRTDGGSGIMIDPQATSRPNGDFSKTSGPSVEDDQISLTGVYDGPRNQYADRGSDSPASGEADSLEEFVLESGESFEFGLWVKTDDSVGSSSSLNASLEIVADATMVPDTYYGDGQ